MLALSFEEKMRIGIYQQNQALPAINYWFNKRVELIYIGTLLIFDSEMNKT